MYCKNCGQEVPSGVTICPNCGARVEGSYFETPPQLPPQESGWKTLWTIIVIVLFVFIGLPSCLFGGCILILTGASSGRASSGAQGWLMGLAALALFGGLLYLLIRAVKGKP